MSELAIVPLRNNLLADHKRDAIKSKIVARLTELNLLQTKYKNDGEFLLLLANLIEHLVMRPDKINKKQLLLDIMSDTFGLTEEEKATISSNVDFLCTNSLIKKVSNYKLFKTGFSEWLFKKA